MTPTTATRDARWWLGSLALITATADDTGGRLSIIEVTEPPNTEAPLHVHHREDEGFYVLDGSLTVFVGDEAAAECGPGDFAWGPRDVPHRYSVGPDGCRMLCICTPGGFERFVTDTSVPAERRTLPPATGDEPDWDLVARAAAANHCELLA